MLTGWPESLPISNPLRLKKAPLQEVAAAVRDDTCHFRKIGELEFRELAARRNQDIAAGHIKLRPPRKIRKDKLTTRGRHRNPKTRTKKRRRGKVTCSPEMIEDSDVEGSDGTEW